MKLLGNAAIAILVLAQCTTTEPKKVEKNVNFEVKTALMPYALSETDSVYSAKITLKSDADTVVKFVATLSLQDSTYADSLIFTLAGGQSINGQIIFSACKFSKNEKPELTSTLKAIE